MKKTRHAFCLGATALACAITWGAGPVHAQGTVPSASPFDPVISFGQTLAKAGIFLDLGYDEVVSSLVSGGKQTGTQPVGHLFATAIFDLQTIANIPGASFHIQFDERNGIPIGTGGGIAATDTILQGDAGPIKYRLADFYWEQGFNEDRIDIIAGRTQPTFDFAFSDVSCQFIASFICAQPGSWYFSNSNQPYGTGEWGGRVNVVVTPQIYARVGIYDDDPSQGGFLPAGFNWNTEHSTGLFIPMEVGYRTGFADTKYPAKYDVGFYDDTSSYKSPTYALNATTTLGGVPIQGRQGGWVQVEQTVWRPDQANNRSLTLFGGAMIYGGNSPYRGQYYAGLLDRGPFLSRPLDTIAAIGNMYLINHNWHPPVSQTYAFELNYGVHIINGLTIKPYVQYVINPYLSATAATGTAIFPGSAAAYKLPSNDVVIGFQVAINLAQMFEFPQFVPH